MKCLIRERLSEHKYKTPEGYLICVDSILARTGKQSYRRSELFQDGDDSEVDVDRPEDEVFSPATLASFENKPIVVEHPDEDVNANNIKQYAVGFVRDVKRGKTADGQDVMLGTLVIQDAQTIEEIENGEHTDLSCGYDCDIADDANPTQRNIRGNHVALCAQGRAGIAKIVDSVKAFDFDAQLQENKLSKTSIEYRKKMSEQPNNKKTLLLEAENIIRQIIDDTDEKDKVTIRRYADKHLSDIRAFAASLKDSVNDSAQEDWFRLLSRNNIAYSFVNGGYGMRFRSVSAYNKAKELAKQVGYTAGHWHDDMLEHFEYSSTVIKNEDSIQEKDNMIKDARYAIWVKEKGQWKPWGSTDKEIDVNELKKRFNYYEDVTLMPNDGSKPRDSITDGSPVDVLNVVQSKRDKTGKTWYLLEISMKSGTHAYIVTADYKGEKTYTGGGAVSFDLNGAKRDLDAFITINELNTKYGQAEGYKRYMAGKKDSVKDAKYRVTSYVDGKILEEKLVNSLTEAQKLAYEFEKQHGRFSTTIQFVYDSVEDADTFEEVTEKLKKNEPNVDDIINAVNAVKAVRRR